MSFLYLLVGAILLLSPQFSSFEQKEADDKTETLLYIEDRFGGHYEEIKEVPHPLDGIKTLLYIEDEVDGHYEVEGADGATYLIYEQKSPIVPFYNSRPLGDLIPSFFKKSVPPSFWHYLTMVLLTTLIPIFLGTRPFLDDRGAEGKGFLLIFGFALTCLTSYLYFVINKKFPATYSSFVGMFGLWVLNLAFTSILVFFGTALGFILYVWLLYIEFYPRYRLLEFKDFLRVNFFLAIVSSFLTLVWLLILEIIKRSLSKKITNSPVADLSLLPEASSSAIDPKLPLAKVA